MAGSGLWSDLTLVLDWAPLVLLEVKDLERIGSNSSLEPTEDKHVVVD